MFPTIAYLTSLPIDELPLEPGSDQPFEVVKALAHRTEAVIVGAYDEEGWLVWRPL